MSKERTEKTHPAAAEITGLSVMIRGPELIGTRFWQEPTTVRIVTISHFMFSNQPITIINLHDWLF